MKKAALLSFLLVAVDLAVAATSAAQQFSQTRTDDLGPVYDTPDKGTTYSELAGPFLIRVDDSFFRKTASYPRGETIAEGMFLFVDVNIFNNSDSSLQIPRFTLQDSGGRTYLTAIRARRSTKAILGGESLNPRAGKRGYLIFDVPLRSGFESLPLRYRLLIANSSHTIDVNVYTKME